jgi:hypothetical protein
MNLNVVLSFVIQHQDVLLGLVFWPLITAIMNVMLRRKSAEAWESWALSKPVPAFLVEVVRAAGFDPAKLMIAGQRYAQRRAGVVPAEALRAAHLPEPVRKALSDPEKLRMFQALIESLDATKPAATPEPTPESAATADSPKPR